MADPQITPSKSCTEQYWVSTTTETAGESPGTYSWFKLGPPTAWNPSCYPSGFAVEEGQYYSPGICPAGYTQACAQVFTTDDVTETVATYCPRHVSRQRWQKPHPLIERN